MTEQTSFPPVSTAYRVYLADNTPCQSKWYTLILPQVKGPFHWDKDLITKIQHSIKCVDKLNKKSTATLPRTQFRWHTGDNVPRHGVDSLQVFKITVMFDFNDKSDLRALNNISGMAAWFCFVHHVPLVSDLCCLCNNWDYYNNDIWHGWRVESRGCILTWMEDRE